MAKRHQVFFTPPESIEVEIAEGLVYNKLAPTKSIQQKITNAINSAESADTEDADPDEVVELFGEIYDLLLRPAGGNKKKASTFIKEQWNNDAMTLEQISEHLERLGEIRPT